MPYTDPHSNVQQHNGTVPAGQGAEKVNFTNQHHGDNYGGGANNQHQQQQAAAPAPRRKDREYPLALPLILQAVRIVFTGPGDDIGKLPSAEHFAECPVTTMEMLPMTGKERRAVLKEYGVLDTQMIYFLRAVHHVCTTNSYTVIRDEEMLLHQRRSSATWCVSMEKPETIKESLLGRPMVLTTESENTSNEARSPNTQKPAAFRGGNGIDAQAIRENTGCVGIRNQGSTCYLNSLIQCLYHLPAFRKAIYGVPLEETDFKAATKTIPLALQTLFYNLQTSLATCETTELTGSFGWSARDTVIQHDVHELSRIMLDNLEEKMKKSNLPNVVEQLFGGEMENWIQVDDVDYRSSRMEVIYDMQLAVKNCSNIYESLDKLFEVEVLEGSNAYCMERDGEKSYHRAERGISITKLPTVLILHLTRFDFDPYKGDMCKVMSRWDFYDTIDLKRYLPKKGTTAAGGPRNTSGDLNGATSSMSLTNDTEEDCEYQLHSVLVHSGSDARFGHYYCFVKVEGKWFKFNDDNVTQATAYETFGCNFGGNTINYWGAKVPKIANGYMLVYIRTSELGGVLTPCTEDMLPETLKKWIEEKRAEEERVRQEKLEEHLYVKIWVMGANDVKEDPKRLHVPSITKAMLDQRHPLRRKMSDTVESAAEEIAQVTGIPPERQQYWGVDYRGMSYRMQKPLAGSASFQDCCLKQDYRSSHECLMYVQDTDLPYFGTKRKDAEVMITHHKLYDPATSCLFYLGSVPVGGGVAMHTSNLEPKLRDLAEVASKDESMSGFFNRLEPSDELEVLLEPDDTGVTPCPVMPASGDIFIWQRKLSEDEAALCDYPTVQDYKHFQTHKRTFNVLLNQPPNFPKQFELTMAYDEDYEKVQKRIAQELNKRGGTMPDFSRHESSGDVTSGDPGTPIDGAPPALPVQKTAEYEEPTATVVGGADLMCAATTAEAPSEADAKKDGESAEAGPSPTAGGNSSSASPSRSRAGGEVDWRHIWLSAWNPDTRSPYFQKPKKKEKHTLRTLLIPLKCNTMVDTLYFQIHEHKVEALESSNPLTFEYFNEHVKSQGSACVLFPYPPKLFIKDVLLGCAQAMNLQEPYPPLRLVDIWRGRLYTIYDRPDEELLAQFEERAEFHIEVMPEKLQHVPDTEQMLVNIGHVNRQPGGASNATPKYQYHGDPFSLWIAHTDLVDDVMDRVALKLDIARQATADWKPLLTVTAHGYDLDPTKPVATQYKALQKERHEENALNFYFALEHAPMVGGRRGNRRVDQSLRINN